MSAELAAPPRICLICGHTKQRRSGGRPGWRCGHCERARSKAWHSGLRCLVLGALAPERFTRTPAEEAEAARRAEVYAGRVDALVAEVGEAVLDGFWPTLRIVGGLEAEGKGDAREDPYRVFCDACGDVMHARQRWHPTCLGCKRRARQAQRAAARARG